MLLSAWSLLAICVVLGLIGLGIAYRQRWAAIVAIAAASAIVALTLLRLRDPLSVTLQNRGAMQDWSYVAVLFWSTVLAIALPLLGKYLGGRKKS